MSAQSGEGPPPGSGGAFLLNPHTVEGARELCSVSFIRDESRSGWVHPHDLSPKAPPANAITFGG